MKTLASEWADFEKRVLTARVGEVQRREMRRAFYAGAAAMLNISCEAAEGPDTEESLEQGATRMEAFSDELRAFGKAMQRGDA